MKADFYSVEFHNLKETAFKVSEMPQINRKR